MRPVDADQILNAANSEEKLIGRDWDYDALKTSIELAATLDVEPVIHAEWEMVDREAFWIGDHEIWEQTGKPTIRQMPICSHCKTEFGIVVLEYKRCPECGAKMDGDRT